MLDQLRDRVVQILAETDLCTLATTGPAGLQASMVHCAGQGIAFYLLVPDTSDHLFNLENEPEVAVTTESWHLRGTAELIEDSLGVFAAEQSQWHTTVKVTPIRLHILPAKDSLTHYAETIDFDG